MATLINGNGNPAVYAEQDADWFASIMGNVTSITGVGQQFEASILDAQTIGVADGVIITKEGRRIQLDANSVDTFEIPVGEQGTTNYYIIGYHLVTGEDSSQTCDTFAQLMESSSATIQEDTFREGADEVYVSLYRVKQVGLTIDTIEPLLPTIQDLNQLNQNLTGLKFFPNVADILSTASTKLTTSYTYTASKNCWVIGFIFSSNDATVTVQIDNVTVANIMQETYAQRVPFTYPLAVGSTIEITGNAYGRIDLTVFGCK